MTSGFNPVRRGDAVVAVREWTEDHSDGAIRRREVLLAVVEVEQRGWAAVVCCPEPLAVADIGYPASADQPISRVYVLDGIGLSDCEAAGYPVGTSWVSEEAARAALLPLLPGC